VWSTFTIGGNGVPSVRPFTVHTVERYAVGLPLHSKYDQLKAMQCALYAQLAA
jgi:hypothetical protein